jgi:hypothetical protein
VQLFGYLLNSTTPSAPPSAIHHTFGYTSLPLALHSQDLDLLPKFLSRQLEIAVLTKPMRLLPPVFPIRQGPPEDIHELLFSLGAALDARGVIAVAVWAGDCLRLVG